jgi:riboflavin kinase/FMN adenylyltransferase
VTSEEFVRDYLHEILRAKVVVVGFNHHFGFNKEGDYKHLWGWREKYNFEAEEIPEQEVQHETVSSTKIRKAISEGYIQRANAYLDHYYIIMGKPVPCDPAGNISFVRIPVTEECKLLPATGIYAVSVVNDKLISKGMSVICHEPGKKPEVLVNIFENGEKYYGYNSLILFHKMIYGSVTMTDTKADQRLESAKAQISELIY